MGICHSQKGHLYLVCIIQITDRLGYSLLSSDLLHNYPNDIYLVRSFNKRSEIISKLIDKTKKCHRQRYTESSTSDKYIRIIKICSSDAVNLSCKQEYPDVSFTLTANNTFSNIAQKIKKCNRLVGIDIHYD